MTVKRKSRSKKSIIKNIVPAALMVITLLLINHFIPVFLKMNGSKTVVIPLNETYSDAGAVSTITGKNIPAEGNVDTSVTGTYRLKYSYLTQNFYRTVKVVDLVSPSITLIGNDVYVLTGNSYIEPGYEVSDNYDTDLNEKVVITSNVNTDIPGEYAINYDVSDSSGNKAETMIRHVYVTDDDFHYENNITNTAKVNSSIQETLIAFMNDYYRSIIYLDHVDMTHYFSDSRSAELWQTSLDTLVETRAMSPYDLKMTEAYYDLNIVASEKTADGYKITVLEDDYFQYGFLNDISRQKDIYNTFFLTEKDGEYKIQDLYHEEAFFIYFDNRYTSDTSLSTLKQEYLAVYEAQNEKYRQMLKEVNSGSITYTGECDEAYNREKAKDYALKYALARNSAFAQFSSNCINYVSQCLNAGGIPMDSSGPLQWKNRGSLDYTFSWSAIDYFYNYYTQLDGSGMVLVENLNLYLAEPGDIIFLDQKERSNYYAPHVLLVTDIVKDSSGNIIDILFCGNTNDQYNIPLSACTYLFKNLGKVIGWNY